MVDQEGLAAASNDPRPELGHEQRVSGPPGTGKTTWLSKAVHSTVVARQTPNVMVASFTTAAAAEVAGRNLPLHRNRIGTLHSFAYRALDTPVVAQELILEWNREHPALALTPKSSRSGSSQSLEESPEEWTGATEADKLLGMLDVARARMEPPETWPTQVRAFEARWTAFKVGNGAVDFTDMIAHALTDVEVAPNSPQVIFADEAQDFTPLELALVRKWGRHADRLVLVGDDDQMIYHFKGARVEGLLEPAIPESDKRVLTQSYRVPRTVHAAASRWVSGLTRREPKEYLPRDAAGAARQVPWRGEDPEPLVEFAAQRADEGRSVMILATCSYMLDKVKHEMRRAGLPFHNPYRRRRGDWNPLHPARGTSSRDRLLAYLICDERVFGDRSRLWTGDDVRAWLAPLKVGPFAKAVKATAEGLPRRELTFDEVEALFADEVELEAAVSPSLDWYARNLLASARPGMEFPLAIARRRGASTLAEEPRVVLGTVHSTKGTEADTVIVMPDLSALGYQEWATAGERRDSVIRLFYVAMTRAREELVVCTQSSPQAVAPELLLRGARKAAA